MAEIVGLIVHIPWLPALKGDDGIELPTFEELTPSLHLRKRVGHGKSEAVANVLVSAGMIQEGARAVHGKERNPV